MTSRERVLRTFRFEQTDHVACDLMESCVWPELETYFREHHGLEDRPQILSFLGTDFHWAGMDYSGPEHRPDAAVTPAEALSRPVVEGPLKDARTVADVEAYDWADPAWWQPQDYAAKRALWQDHALVLGTGWSPLFWGACEAFGVEAALVNLLTRPVLFDAFVHLRHEFTMDILRRGLSAAQGHCDICWLGDDFSTQQSMFLSPDHWRKHIKPCLAEQVRLAREHGLLVLYHSCGAVRPVLGDLIDIGVNSLLVFQTTAAGMDAASIANEFGGRLAFYGGMDVQQLLSYGSVEEVRETVRANVRAFEKCGGYVVANSHHRVATIRGENVVAMCRAAKECSFSVR
ncbi:uroporphyrinogen decarboxylase family protein [Verrucomicrobiota bacterium]